MSSYAYDDDGPRRYRNVQTRPRGRDEPDYVVEETYIERGKGSGPGPRDLVYRSREDSIEDIPRDFPPPGGRERDYRQSNYRSERNIYDDRRSKSAGRGYDDDYYSEDDRYTDYSRSRATGAGARRRRNRSYSSERSYSSARSERRKSGGLLDSLGLGALAGAITGNKKNRDRSADRSVRSGRSRSRAASRASRRRYSSDERSRGGDSKDKSEKKWAQAAQAALIAGAITAIQSRKDPGPWNGEKGKRIATAALGAGGIDGLLDRNPNEKTKRHLAEAVIGGLAANRLANGPRSKSRGRDISVSPDRRARSRSRSIFDRFRGRSQSRPRSMDRGVDGGGGGGSGALKSLAAGAGLAAAGTAVYNRVRSKSRKRHSRSRESSADSYVPSRNRRRGKRRSQPSGQGDRGRSRDINNSANGGDGSRDLVGAAAAGGGAVALAKSGQGGQGGQSQSGQGNRGKAQSTADSEHASDSSSTTDMENKRKHMRGKELLTAGLATIATIHAAHGVYSSMEAHEKRHKMVAEGEMSPEEARKKQTKAWVQDAAAVGIAALGIKGAFSEWKEMNEHRREIHSLEQRKRQRRKRQEQQERQRQQENEERFFKALEQNPQLAMMQQQQTPAGVPTFNMPQPYRPGGGGRYQPTPDQSGNPYAPQAGGSGGGRQ